MLAGRVLFLLLFLVDLVRSHKSEYPVSYDLFSSWSPGLISAGWVGALGLRVLIHIRENTEEVEGKEMR